jgi:hypothetical protein
MFVTVLNLIFFPCGAPSLTRRRVYHSSVTVCSSQSVHDKVHIYILFVMAWYDTSHVHGIYKATFSPGWDSRLFSISSSSQYNGSLRLRLRLRNAISIFYYLFLSRYMFWSYDHLQVEVYTMEINLTDNGSVVFFKNICYPGRLRWQVWS